MLVDNSFLERNDRVIRDGDVLGTNLGAALCDVAVADAATVLELVGSIEDIQRMHFQLGCVHKQPGPHELLVQMMVAENVTDILAEEALDALAEFLYAVDIGLLHAPGSVGCIGRTRSEPSDAFFCAEVG